MADAVNLPPRALARVAVDLYQEYVASGRMTDADDGDISRDHDLEFFAELEGRISNFSGARSEI